MIILQDKVLFSFVLPKTLPHPDRFRASHKGFFPHPNSSMIIPGVEGKMNLRVGNSSKKGLFFCMNPGMKQRFEGAVSDERKNGCVCSNASRILSS